MNECPNGKRLTYEQFHEEGYTRIGTSLAIDNRNLARKLNELAARLRMFDEIDIETGVRVDNGKGVELSKVTVLHEPI